VTRKPPLTQAQVNGAAWHEGCRLLRRAIASAPISPLNDAGRQDHGRAARAGAQQDWRCMSGSWDPDVELHIDRVRRRVAKGATIFEEKDGSDSERPPQSDTVVTALGRASPLR